MCCILNKRNICYEWAKWYVSTKYIFSQVYVVVLRVINWDEKYILKCFYCVVVRFFLTAPNDFSFMLVRCFFPAWSERFAQITGLSRPWLDRETHLWAPGWRRTGVAPKSHRLASFYCTLAASTRLSKETVCDRSEQTQRVLSTSAQTTNVSKLFWIWSKPANSAHDN